MKKAKLDKKSIKNVLLASYNPETEKNNTTNKKIIIEFINFL